MWLFSCHWNKVLNIHNLKDERFIWLMVFRFNLWLVGPQVEVHGRRARQRKATHPIMARKQREEEPEARIHPPRPWATWPTSNQAPPSASTFSTTMTFQKLHFWIHETFGRQFRSHLWQVYYDSSFLPLISASDLTVLQFILQISSSFLLTAWKLSLVPYL